MLPRPFIRFTAVFATAAVVVLGLGVAPASAATVVTASSRGELFAALNDDAVTSVRIIADFAVDDDTLGVPHTVTIDLNGYTVVASNLTVNLGTTLTIVDTSDDTTGQLRATATTNSGLAGITVIGSLRLGTATEPGGTIIAIGSCNTASAGDTSGFCGAGIGGDAEAGSGPIMINSGAVTATGAGSSKSSGGGAGIGGGSTNPATIVDINGGIVEARGGNGAAGIGGGGGAGGGQGGSITIDNATVTAPQIYGTGIGGGAGWGTGYSFGAHVTIGAGSHVTADSIVAVGPDGGSPTTAVGSFIVDGEFTIPTGRDLRLQSPGIATVGPAGVITGEGTIAGDGTIANGGAIRNADVSAVVTGNNFEVDFLGNAADAAPASQPVRVYAVTMLAGARSIPSAPTNPQADFVDWFTASTGGSVFSTTTTLTADTDVFAHYQGPASLSVTPSATTRIAGDATTFTVEGFDSDEVSLGDYTGRVTFSTSNGSADDVAGNIIRFGTAGSTTVTATLDDDTTVSATSLITVTADTASPTSLQLTLSAATVDQGDTLSFAATAQDAYGNSFDVSTLITVTSSVDSDVVSGNTVRFPHASPHVITARLGTLTSSVTVQVAPAGLATTGVPANPWLLVFALALAGAGLALVLGQRRVSTH